MQRFHFLFIIYHKVHTKTGKLAFKNKTFFFDNSAFSEHINHYKFLNFYLILTIIRVKPDLYMVKSG